MSEKISKPSEQESIMRKDKSLQAKKIAKAAIQIAKEGGRDNIKTAPEDYSSLRGLAKDLGIDKQAIKKRIEQLEIKGKLFKDKTGSNLTYFYGPEEKKKIYEALGDLMKLKAPEGYLPLNSLPEALGIDADKATIKSKIETLGITGEKYKGKNGRVYTFYSPDEQVSIKNNFDELQSIEQLPETGYYTINSMRESIAGVGFHTIKKAINELSLAGKPLKDNRGVINTYYSEEERQEIINHLEKHILSEYAEKDELTLTGLSKKLGIDKETLGRRIEILQSDGETLGKTKKRGATIAVFYSLEEQAIIKNALEHCLTWTSIPENTIAFYLNKIEPNIQLNTRPDWLKNPNTNQRLEVDIFCPSLDAGIEYDGFFYHQDSEHDMIKDQLAQKNGYKIVHIREKGCPEMPDNSICVKREDNSDDKDLERCLKECFRLLGAFEPDIDIARDKKDIMSFMQQRVLKRLDAAKAFEELSVAS